MILPILDREPRTHSPWLSHLLLLVIGVATTRNLLLPPGASWAGYFGFESELFVLGLLALAPVVYVTTVVSLCMVVSERVEEVLEAGWFLAVLTPPLVLGAVLGVDSEAHAPRAGYGPEAATGALLGALYGIHPGATIRFLCWIPGSGREGRLFARFELELVQVLWLWVGLQWIAWVVPVVEHSAVAGGLSVLVGYGIARLARGSTRDATTLEEHLSVPVAADATPADVRDRRGVGVRSRPSRRRGSRAAAAPAPHGDVPVQPPRPDLGEEIAHLEVGPRRDYSRSELPRFQEPEATSWSVIRTRDRDVDITRVGRIVHEHTGEPRHDAALRIRNSRGLLAVGLARPDADHLVRALQEAGLAVAAVPWLPSELPPRHTATAAAWSAYSVAVRLDGGEELNLPWRRMRLLVAAQVHETDVVTQHAPVDSGLWENDLAASLLGLDRFGGSPPDLEVRQRKVPFIEMLAAPGSTVPAPGEPLEFTSWLRVRIAHGCVFVGDNVGKGGNLRRLARVLLRHRAATPTNPGLRALARRGRWGYLDFSGESGYELYLAWLLTILRWGHRQQEDAPWQ